MSDDDTRPVIPCPHCAADVPNPLLPRKPQTEPVRATSTEIAAGEPPIRSTESENGFEVICVQCGTSFSGVLLRCPECRATLSNEKGNADNTAHLSDKGRFVLMNIGVVLGIFMGWPTLIAWFQNYAERLVVVWISILILVGCAGVKLRYSKGRSAQVWGQGLLAVTAGLVFGLGFVFGFCGFLSGTCGFRV